MSASPDTDRLEMRELRQLPVADIDRNAANPRLHFTEEELEKLSESIAIEGVLVPVVVHENESGDGWILIDGERRWRCAKSLALPTIPAVITAPTNRRQNLVQMFNIHMVREAWKDMPTAWALQQLIEESGIEDERGLADLTGLSIERVKRLRYALQLPKEYQRYIDDGRIPLNFFWELKRNVIDPLAKQRPGVWQEFGDAGVLEAFTNKRLNEVITDVISLRNVRPMINIAMREAGDPLGDSVIDDTLRELILDAEKTIEEAYEDTVEVVVEADRLERKAANLAKSFRRLLDKAKSEEERSRIRDVARQHIAELQALLD